MPTWFQTTQIARPTYYDRNAATALVGFSLGGVAPHGTTVRAGYTVPTNKKSFLDSLWMDIIRDGATATFGTVLVRLNYSPFGGGAAIMFQTFQNQGTALVESQTVLPQFGYMSPGDSFTLTTSDASIGGTNAFNVNAKKTEFDL